MGSEEGEKGNSEDERRLGGGVSRARARSLEMARSSFARVRALRAEAADLLARGLRPRLVSSALIERHGLGRRQADRYVASVLIELQRDSVEEPMSAKRARMVAMLERVHTLALDAKRTYQSRDGEVIEVPAPDLRSALGALSQLADVEGLLADPNQPGREGGGR